MSKSIKRLLIEAEERKDDIDWKSVRSAAKKTAKEVHGDVDDDAIDGIITNAKKHKPENTAAAIELVQDMLRESIEEEYEEISGEEPEPINKVLSYLKKELPTSSVQSRAQVVELIYSLNREGKISGEEAESAKQDLFGDKWSDISQKYNITESLNEGHDMVIALVQRLHDWVREVIGEIPRPSTEADQIKDSERFFDITSGSEGVQMWVDYDDYSLSVSVVQGGDRGKRRYLTDKLQVMLQSEQWADEIDSNPSIGSVSGVLKFEGTSIGESLKEASDRSADAFAGLVGKWVQYHLGGTQKKITGKSVTGGRSYVIKEAGVTVDILVDEDNEFDIEVKAKDKSMRKFIVDGLVKMIKKDKIGTLGKATSSSMGLVQGTINTASKYIPEGEERDVVDWSDVKDAAMKTAKEVHGEVDKEKVDGIIANAKKHKPDSTAAAIELVQNMLSESLHEGKIGDFLRKVKGAVRVKRDKQPQDDFISDKEYNEISRQIKKDYPGYEIHGLGPLPNDRIAVGIAKTPTGLMTNLVWDQKTNKLSKAKGNELTEDLDEEDFDKIKDKYGYKDHGTGRMSYRKGKGMAGVKGGKRMIGLVYIDFPDEQSERDLKKYFQKDKKGRWYYPVMQRGAHVPKMNIEKKTAEQLQKKFGGKVTRDVKLK